MRSSFSYKGCYFCHQLDHIFSLSLPIIFIIATLINVCSTQCPTGCHPDSCNRGLMLCSDSNMLTIPLLPPKSTVKVIITNQRFENPNLSYRNLSKYGPEYINLISLTIQNCGIRDIESESFSHLISLSYLDLSRNSIRLIKPNTFKALNLKTLKLNENRLLMLDKYSLKGLVVNFLYLSNCGLKELKFESIKEVSGHLSRLDLSNNNINSLDKEFFLLFQRLEELRLEGNDIKCDCRLKWLGKIFKMKQSLSGQFTSIVCASPANLRGKLIANIPKSEFVCPKPVLEKIYIDIKSVNEAFLSCFSSGATKNKVSWLMRDRSTSSSSSSSSSSSDLMSNNLIQLVESDKIASIDVYKKAKKNYYRCLIVNDNGNVSVDISIIWPSIKKSNLYIKNKSENNHLQTTPIIDYGSRKSDLFMKQFTLFEMLLSIFSTFIITIIFFSALYFIFMRKCLDKTYRANMANSSLNQPFVSPSKFRSNIAGYEIYSPDSQIYDVPSPARCLYNNSTSNNNHINQTNLNNNNNNNIINTSSSPNLTSPCDVQTHLIDFKTQKRLVNPSQ